MEKVKAPITKLVPGPPEMLISLAARSLLQVSIVGSSVNLMTPIGSGNFRKLTYESAI